MSKADMKNVRHDAYQMDGPRSNGSLELHAFDSDKVLLDPYAKSVHFPESFDGQARHVSRLEHWARPRWAFCTKTNPPLTGAMIKGLLFHQNDLVIYEMHVRGFTRRGNSGVRAEDRGTYRGIIDKIPYLRELGVTAVELLPVHQYDPLEGNYWGDMTLNSLCLTTPTRPLL